MSAAALTKPETPGKAAAFATPATVSTTAASAEPLTAEPASTHLDADIIAACAEYERAKVAYNKFGGEVEYDADPWWPLYEKARDAVSDACPQSWAGFAAKARCAISDATQPDGSVQPQNVMAASWSWQLMSDALRLSQELPSGAYDAALLADHRLYDDLERQWIASFDQGLEEKEAEALQARLRRMQAPVLERIAKRRAVTMEGLGARLRTLLLECQDKDFGTDAERSGLGLDERLTATLVRDLAGVLGISLEDAPKKSTVTPTHLEQPTITILVEWMAAAWAAQGHFDQQALEAKKARNMRAAALHASASDRETGRAIALEKLILASPVTSVSDAIGQIMVVLTSVTAVANELDGQHHHTLYSLFETGVVALATVSQQHGIDLARIGGDLLTGRALDRIKEEVG
jgi:hypothetical protein